MKEATGELNMTVITIVAIAGIAALFVAFILPRIREKIGTQVDSADTMTQGQCNNACGGADNVQEFDAATGTCVCNP